MFYAIMKSPCDVTSTRAMPLYIHRGGKRLASHKHDRLIEPPSTEEELVLALIMNKNK